MRALLVVAILALALPARTAAAPKAKKPAAAEKEGAAPAADKNPPAEKPAEKAAAKDKPAELSLNRVAFVQSAVGPRVPRPVALQVLEVAETDIKAQGFEAVGFNQVVAEHARQKKALAPCADSAPCLAAIGKVTGAAWVVNLSINQAPKTLGVKLTIVDVAEAKVVSNILAFVNSNDPEKLKEAVRKLVPRAILALQKASEERKAARAEADSLAVAPLVPDSKVEPKQELAIVTPGHSAPEVKPEPTPDPMAISDAPTATRKRAPPPEPRSRSIVPFVAMGAGAVAIGVGVGVFGRQASAAVTQFKAGEDPAAARSTARSKALLADLVTGVGIAGVAVGVVMLLTGGDAGPDPTAPSVSLDLSPTHQGLALSGSF